AALAAYMAAVDVQGAIAALREPSGAEGLRRAYLEGLAECLGVMWDLGQEILGQGQAVPYERCVRASTGAPPQASTPVARRLRLADLLARAGHPSEGQGASLLAAADRWRAERLVPGKAIRALSGAFIAEFDALAQRHLAPYLPQALRTVPRANIRFLPIKDAWFSGSMNYLGRERTPDGRPRYEATYEINASLQISVPEFQQLVSHEVVPGHVTTFAFLQDLYQRRQVGFEATVLTMNTRAAALFEGLANNAILIAHGVTDLDQLPDEDLQIGVLLALLQDDAKNQSSYLTWMEGWAQPDVARVLRAEYLVSEERAQKLSGAWGRHPLLGRMYLPCYRAGTEKIAALRSLHGPEQILPALYGCRGLVDVVTLDRALG
ncbi:MAG TPA: hypothetical protein VFO85_05925, partial [Vicinamibacteria bacterium]|nr:hypothetical protein [Vicinamibacteria bacterium]